jgi:NAD(P)H-flavin reductase
MCTVQTSEFESPRVDLDPMVPRLFTIESRRQDLADTFTLRLRPVDPGPYVFAPGQFNMLWAPGVGEVPISISGDPTSPDTLVHTTRIVGAVTQALGRLRRGDTVGVRGPFGTAWPVEEAVGRDVVIVAGGLGLAPLRPAILSVIQKRARFGRVALLYGARRPQEILFRREFERWRARLDIDTQLTVDRGTDDWRGNVGVVTTLIPRIPFDPSSAVAWICGPEVMMRYTVMGLEERGLAKERMHISMERNMKCAIGLCGHCQWGPTFVCRDGPVFAYSSVEGMLRTREI